MFMNAGLFVNSMFLSVVHKNNGLVKGHYLLLSQASNVDSVLLKLDHKSYIRIVFDF